MRKTFLLTSTVAVLLIMWTTVTSFVENWSDSAHAKISNKVDAPARGPVCGTPNIVFPLYSYPNWYDPENYIWDDVSIASTTISITAIINPNSGPLSCPLNPDFTQGLQDLRTDQIKIIGYVLTNFGERESSLVKADIDTYYQCYGVDGIFLDQVSNTAANLDYYEDISSHIKANENNGIVFINPGAPIDEQYLTRSVADVAIISEASFDQWQNYQPSSYLRSYSADTFGMITYNASSPTDMQQSIDLALANHIEYVYVTDDVLPNPFDSLPTYWSEQIAHIEASEECKSTMLPLVIRD